MTKKTDTTKTGATHKQGDSVGSHLISSTPAVVLLLALSLALVPAPSPAATTIVPAANSNSEGSQLNGGPFSGDVLCSDGAHYQQLYSGGEIGINSISAISFRLDSFQAAPGPTSFPGVTVTLSSTSATHASLSTTFADNVGADATVVFSGNLDVDPTVSGSPNPFDFTIDFATAFGFAGPSANLLLDIVVDNCWQDSPIYLDAENDSVLSSIFADRDEIVGARFPGLGLITEFAGSVVQHMPYVMGAGGNWAVVGHNGEGFLFEPMADGTVVIFWFTYDTSGNQVWLIGVASPGDFADDPVTGQNVGTVNMYRTSGPSFGPAYDPTDYSEELIGSVTFRLNGCVQSAGATGEAEYDLGSGFGSGTYSIEKLYDISGNDCSL